ncbi:hypothetical protein BBR47_20900 [Brevibacillus brevis NBRC 100599]|uniref:Uncharacterized protein n=1 Tax=Brevibacillus brevis (strain 47 / JCM 6285 / NBRC 100599) TaxID=358681 RepID=C0ZBA8_BREBN|nr:hypothetical protein BBR47_20900 [Brevibacillus brevis NBRC 100599]
MRGISRSLSDYDEYDDQKDKEDKDQGKIVIAAHKKHPPSRT